MTAIASVAVLLATWTTPSHLTAQQQTSQPDIVVILVDDMGYSDLGAMGGEMRTPAIDALADDGIIFTNFYNAARCWPTRASLLTGLYHHRAGLGGASPPEDTTVITEPGPYQRYLNESPTFAEVLSESGYRTYMSGKWHLGARREQWPRRRGFDRYFGLISGASSYFEIITDQRRIRRMVSDDEYWWPPDEGFYMTEAITDSALSFVTQHFENHPDDPFLLYLAYTAPHWPLHALEDDIAVYEGRFDAGWDRLRVERQRRMLDLGIIDERHVLPRRPVGISAWQDTPDQALWTRRMEVHAAMIHRVDLGVGRLVRLLEKSGRLENTLVLFLSDNGASAEDVEGRGLNDPSVPVGAPGSYDAIREPWANLSNTPFRRYKKSMFEGGVRTPLIVHWPAGIQGPGRIQRTPGHVIDIAPTLYEAAGIRNSPDMDGVSIAPAFGASDLESRNIYFEHLGGRAMLSGAFKIVADPDKPWRVYDLAPDPTELHDLADRRPLLIDSLVSAWTSWAKEADVRLDESQRRQSPNFVVLVADDAGWSDFGAYGNEVILTPNIDGLARSGLTFERALLTTPQCSPSRISILTGKYPHATGAEDLHMPLPDDEIFLSTLLSDAGYLTGHMHKTHYGPNGEAQFDWYSNHLDDFTEFLDSASGLPFFMWVGFTDPHRPYADEQIRALHSPDSVFVPRHLLDTPATRRDLADYYDEIARMDSVIGSYMAALEDRGLRDNTVVIFLSDNGAPFPRAKGTLYDLGIRTPLIVSWPDSVDADSRTEVLASAVDLAPTILDIAGVEVPNSMHGHSMADVLTGDRATGRTLAFSERNWHNCDEHQRSVTSVRYKLIQNAYLDLPQCTAADISRSPSWQDLFRANRSGTLSHTQRLLFTVPRPEYELYDLERDPNEYDNLADDPAYADVFGTLKVVLEQWKWKTDDFPPERRRRPDNTDRVTGVKFMQEIPEMVE